MKVLEAPRTTLLKTTHRLPILAGMRRVFSPHSCVFRVVLSMALLAWAAFGVEAVAHPLSMLDGAMGHTQMTVGHVSCDDMPMPHATADASPHSATTHPPGSGQGCCQPGACWCAFSCGGIVSVPCLDLKLQPAYAFVLAVVQPQLVRSRSAPPLRPPIA